MIKNIIFAFPWSSHPLPFKLFTLTKGEVTRIGDARKLIASISV